jgi:hypothetical protein
MHGLGIDGGQHQSVEGTILRADSRKGVFVLAPPLPRDLGPPASGGPAAARITDPPETSLVLAQQAHGSGRARDIDLRRYLLLNDLR